MFTVPGVPVGTEAVIKVPLALTVNVVVVPPKRTSEVPLKPVPEILTLPPPAAGPLFGLTPVTDGPTKVYRSAGVIELVPFGVTTLTSTVPASSAGVLTISLVPLRFQCGLIPGVDPKRTSVAPRKLVPVISHAGPRQKDHSCG